MEGEIAEDGRSGILEFTVRDEQGNPLPDREPSTYRLTKITSEYCPATGVWNYYSESDFIYNSNSGFDEGGPPYQATVEIAEDEDRNIMISGFYNMSSGNGTGTRRLNNLNVIMPLASGEGEFSATISQDDREITGAIHLSEKRHQSSAMIRFTMTRQTECGEDLNSSPSPGDVIDDVLDVLF